MIELRKVTFRYGSKAPILSGFDWRVEAGEIWAIQGPSGCGKSTLLYLLAGLRLPSEGEVSIGGEPISSPRPKTGLILQDFGLLPWATVLENAALGLRIRGFYGPDGVHAPAGVTTEVGLEAASGWVEQLGLKAVADQYPGQISGGQRQRTAIARTLALRPDILLMDEPFASLDAPTRENLQSLVLELHNEHKLTIVMVTHSIEEAAALGHKVLVLNQPPNQTPMVIANPGAGQPNYTETQTYSEVCARLRQALEERG